MFNEVRYAFYADFKFGKTNNQISMKIHFFSIDINPYPLKINEATEFQFTFIHWNTEFWITLLLRNYSENIYPITFSQYISSEFSKALLHFGTVNWNRKKVSKWFSLSGSIYYQIDSGFSRNNTFSVMTLDY